MAQKKPAAPKATPTAPCPVASCCPTPNHLILVATFPRPSGSEEAARKADHWEPTTDDFMAVANWERARAPSCILVQKVTNLRSWVDAIANRPPKSLSQVSLITHANKDNLALSGTVDWSNGSVTLRGSVPFSMNLDPADANNAVLDGSLGLDMALLGGMGGRGWFDNEDRGGKTAVRVRGALAPGAFFNFYSCGSGNPTSFTNTLIFQKVADIFGVSVRGLSSKFIWYRPEWEKPPPDRSRTGIGATWSNDAELKLAPGVFHDNPDMLVLTPRAP